MTVKTSWSLVLLREGDFAGYRSGRSRLNGMSQAFITAADRFLADSRATADALVAAAAHRAETLEDQAGLLMRELREFRLTHQ
ncbi:MAG TPA: hypothetical protein VFX91_11870 [Alcanivorax sp.]|nr:hypothetical protein [Alcanivorax sp.]